MVDRLLTEVDIAASRADAWWIVADELRPILGEAPGGGAHLMAFDYILTRSRSRRRERYGTFGPRHEFDAPDALTGYPPPIGLVPDAVINSWREATRVVVAPLALSRYADLIYVVESGSSALQFEARGAEAFDAYFRLLVERQLRSSTAGLAAARAAEIARDLTDANRLEALSTYLRSAAARLSLSPASIRDALVAMDGQA